MKEIWCADFYIYVSTVEKTTEHFPKDPEKGSEELTKICYSTPQNNY